MTSRQSLRASLRQQRASLTDTERWYKGLEASRALQTHPLFRRSHHLGLYLAVGTECPTLALSVEAEHSGKQVYYPAIGLHRKQHMEFVLADNRSQWRHGAYRIPQPIPRRPADLRPARHLDLVIFPLVGFDGQGNRLGMGAGYYDRCFAFRRHRRHWKRPLLIGLAYDCQRVDTIPHEPWDVPLDGVATESGLTLFK